MLSFFIRRVLTLAATIVCVFAFGASPAVPDTGLQNVGLSCSDGTNLGLTLSTTDVTNLTNATTAMTLFPALLSCAVSTQSDPPPGGNSQQDYAVGGGDQFFTQPKLEAPCKINFGFSVHTPSNSPALAKGTFTETVPGGCAGLGDSGQLRVDVNCLDVHGSLADMRGTVTKATGQFAQSGTFPPEPPFMVGHPAYISAGDFGGPARDLLGVSTVPDGTSPSCQGTTNQAATSNGNINVHDAG